MIRSTSFALLAAALFSGCPSPASLDLSRDCNAVVPGTTFETRYDPGDLGVIGPIVSIDDGEVLAVRVRGMSVEIEARSEGSADLTLQTSADGCETDYPFEVTQPDDLQFRFADFELEERINILDGHAERLDLRLYYDELNMYGGHDAIAASPDLLGVATLRARPVEIDEDFEGEVDAQYRDLRASLEIARTRAAEVGVRTRETERDGLDVAELAAPGGAQLLYPEVEVFADGESLGTGHGIYFSPGDVEHRVSFTLDGETYAADIGTAPNANFSLSAFPSP